MVIFAFGPGAIAQNAAMPYPSKPIRLIVPFAAGGPTDLLARVIAVNMTENWGQPVIIDNRAGAAGSIGAEMAAKAPPDGYTLLLSTAGVLTVNPALTKVRFDTVKDFEPIGLTATLSSIMVVHPSLKVTTVKQLIQLAKNRPGELNYASAGNGSASHLAMEKFNRAADVKINHIPYKGAAPAVTDLVGGTVQIMLIGLPTVMPHVAAGRVVPLGVASLAPSSLAPNIVTIAHSAGLPGFEVSNWLGIVAPAGTPRDIIDKLNAEIVHILSIPAVKDQLIKGGFEPVTSSPEKFKAHIDSELKSWAKIVKEAGITGG